MRTLVAGFGNALLGDDGFGVEVIRRLRETGVAGAEVELLDVGTGGIRLAQALLDGYDRLVVVDALARGGAPGSLYVLEVESVAAVSEVDPHLAVPAPALSVARALGVLPRIVFMVGCEPAPIDEPRTELSPAVRGVLDDALALIRRLLAAGTAPSHAKRS